ncbi:dihydropteroate synthase [Oryzomicrobium sp.]|uniref:dihydropteroate synthase n=1 Tax=Oryzomicrobium sp. TaxID=1911578 RepID=UPI002FDFA34F
MNHLHCAAYRLPLDRPLVMGIVNLTPDSFTGDGLAGGGDVVARAIEHARAQWEAGADILDLGAESTRPGAIATPLQEELDRLLPLLEAIAGWGVPVSIDTYKPEVMRAAIAAGAAMINDICGLTRPGALEAVAASDVGVCLMHMQGEPGTMQVAPQYRDVVAEVGDFLAGRVDACRAAGIDDARIVLDPGFGFGKTLEHNLALLRDLPATSPEGLPILAGMSRKTMIGQITGRPVAERLPGSLAAALLAADGGAKIIRVHDVAATRDVLSVWQAVRQQ